MADSKLASPRTSSPPPHCAICLGSCSNKCYSDSCKHEFCFKCLLEWSKIKAECPLCKQAFKSIIHNIKSVEEYDEHVVENITVDENRIYDNASLIYLPPATPPALQYHFRTTFTVDTHGEHAIQQMLLSHPLLQTFGTFNPDRPGHRHYGHGHHRRRRGDTSTSFRRAIYNENLWVYAPPDVTGRYREVSPSFFRNNPAARTRLVPWLNRELNALLYENTQQVMHLVDVIMEHLLRYHICSYSFRLLLSTYLGNKADHFIHEFYNFMRSPFDMIGYDRHVIYTTRPPSPPSNIDLSDNDSDVILVSDTNNNSRETPQTAHEPVIIDLVDTDSDEPIIVEERRCEEVGADEEEAEQRKPILPLKLRLKNLRHKSSKEIKSKLKKRHRYLFSNSSSSSSTSSSSSDEENVTYERFRERKNRKKHKREKKRRRDGHYVSHTSSPAIDVKPVLSASSASECDLPLSMLRAKSSSSSATVTSSSHAVDSTKKVCSDSETVSDQNFYSDMQRPNGRSKVKSVRSDDRYNAGPSNGPLRNIFKKEKNSNLWYSRPCVYDSDSSDY